MLTACLLMLTAAPELLPALPQAEHGLHYTDPAMVWDEAMPLGNGILGALVWSDGAPVKISLDRTDLWDLRLVEEYYSEDYQYQLMRQWEKEGRTDELLAMYDNPYHRPGPTKIPAGRIELDIDTTPTFKEARLMLKNALAGIHFSNEDRLMTFVHATEPIGVFMYTGPKNFTPRLVAPAFGGKDPGESKPSIVAGELANLGYEPPVLSSGDNWSAYTQEGWGGFNFAVYMRWEYFEEALIGAWTVASSYENAVPLALAKKRVDAAIASQEAITQLQQSHTAWWENYWKKSTITVPNDVIERQWYLDTYKFGAASRLGAPPITLQGPWTADDGKLPPWKGDYHHDLNTELSYWPCYSGNRLEEGQNFVDWLWDTRDECKAWTKRFFDMPGMNVPMTADLKNRQMGGWRQYTHSSTTAAWLAHHFYLHWRFSGDDTFLKERAYPYLSDVSTFLEAVTKERDENGKRRLPLSSSPEINDNKPNAWFPTITNYDLALIRWCLGTTAEMADLLGKTDEATHWRGVRDELPSLSTGADGRLLIAKDYPLPASHRHFSHLMAIHPLGLVDVSQGDHDRRIINASLAELEEKGTKLWTGYSFSWLGNMAARAKDGAKAEAALELFAKAFVLRNSFHCNGDQTGKGYSNFTYRPFTLEGNFAFGAGVQEMLLQSHAGEIEIFPAVPDSWTDLQFTTLRAQGAFLVSAQREAGKVSRCEITATKDSTCILRHPVSGDIVKRTMAAGETWNLIEAK